MKNIKSFALSLLLLCAVISSCVSNQTINEAPYPTLHGQFTYFEEKNQLYSTFPIEKGDIVLVGDDMFDRGMWDSFYGSQKIKNRGIALEGTECTYYRIASIAEKHPSQIYICTGLYDIKKGKGTEETLERIIGTVSRAKVVSPRTKIYVVGIIADRAIEKLSSDSLMLRDSIECINASLKEIYGQRFIDLSSVLRDSSGYISRDYTYDGVRINGKGYFEFAKLLSPYIGYKALNDPYTNDSTIDIYNTIHSGRSAHYRARLSIFNSLPNTSGKVLMLGNSLNNNCWWNELLESGEVINRGISGDTVDGILLRVDDVIEEAPRRIYLLTGINDFINDPTKSVEEVWNFYHALLEELRNRLPNSELFVQSILPLNPVSPYYEGRNEKAERVNRLLFEYSNSLNYTYIDLASELKDADGNLDIQYTLDGIHLLPSAYAIWKKHISLD